MRARPVTILVLLTVIAMVLLACAGTNQTSSSPSGHALEGTNMQDHPAPTFRLLDQNGVQVSLASLHGHPVVLTFLDATCTEQCPLMVQYLNWTTQFLTPKQVAAVDWVAISVNPLNTPAQAQAFLTKNKTVMPMHFLLGSQGQLAPLWKAYYIAVQPGQTDVAHTSGLLLIDQTGHERIWLDAGFDPKDLSGDIQSLLATG
jgi:protein SCO1/2